MDELATRVRARIDAAAKVYVVMLSVPGRLAWLASELNKAQHAADKRVDAVLEHMRWIGVQATGTPGMTAC